MQSTGILRPLKVLYIVNHAVPYGANVALLNILDGVQGRGVMPMVVLGEKGVLCEELEKRDIRYEVVKHHFSAFPGLTSLRDYVLFLPKLFRMLITNQIAVKKVEEIAKRFGADIIHTNIGPSLIGFIVARNLETPHVWHIREYQDLDFDIHAFPSKDNFNKKLRKRNNFPIAITRGIFSHFKMKENACVIYDGVLRKSQTQFSIIKNNYFLFVGRLEETKGIRKLIEAFIEFSKNNLDFELRIAGHGNDDYILELKKMVSAANLSNRIHFLGFRKDVHDLMANAFALVVASRYEGFGFITVEAMFNGCLVIGNNTGGTKEILEKEDLGILYSGHNALVSAMNSVVANGIECYFPMIKKAQKQAVALYSKEHNAEAVFRLYTEIIESQGAFKECDC